MINANINGRKEQNSETISERYLPFAILITAIIWLKNRNVLSRFWPILAHPQANSQMTKHLSSARLSFIEAGAAL